MRFRILTSLLIIAGIFASYHGFDPISQTGQQKDSKQRLVYYIDSIETRTFDKRGVLTQTLKTDKLNQVSGESTVKLDNIDLIINTDKQQWRVTAKNGITDSALQKLTLNNQVELAKSDQTAQVSTESIEYNSLTGILSSNEPVSIYLNGSKTTANKLKVDLDKQLIELIGNVQTHYDPNNNKDTVPATGG